MYFPVLLQMLNIILTESYKIFVKNRDLIYMTRFLIVPTQQWYCLHHSHGGSCPSWQTPNSCGNSRAVKCSVCRKGFRNRSIIPTFLSCSTCEARVHKKCIKTTSYTCQKCEEVQQLSSSSQCWLTGAATASSTGSRPPSWWRAWGWGPRRASTATRTPPACRSSTPWS